MLIIFVVSSAVSHLVLFSGSICGGHSVLAAPPGVPLIPVGGHLLGSPLSKHLVQVEPAPVAHEERAHLEGRTGGLISRRTTRTCVLHRVLRGMHEGRRWIRGGGSTETHLSRCLGSDHFSDHCEVFPIATDGWGKKKQQKIKVNCQIARQTKRITVVRVCVCVYIRHKLAAVYWSGPNSQCCN